MLEHPGTSGGVVEGPCLGGRIELGIREDLTQHQGSDGKISVPHQQGRDRDILQRF